MQFISYNIHMAVRLPVILSEFKKRDLMTKTAIFCLQEASVNGLKNSCDEILESFPMLPLAYKFEPCNELNGKIQANGIIYRKDIFEPVSYSAIQLPTLPKIFQLIGISIFWKRRIEPRICQNLLLKTQDGKYVRILNTHLDFLGGWMHTFQQLGKILHIFRKKRKMADVTLLCGDFNTMIFRKRHKKYREKLLEFLAIHHLYDMTKHIKNTYQFKPAEVKKFVAAPFFSQLVGYLRIPIRQKLDWILIYRKDKTQKIPDAQVLSMPGSDHLPLVANIEI